MYGYCRVLQEPAEYCRLRRNAGYCGVMQGSMGYCEVLQSTAGYTRGVLGGNYLCTLGTASTGQNWGGYSTGSALQYPEVPCSTHTLPCNTYQNPQYPAVSHSTRHQYLTLPRSTLQYQQSPKVPLVPPSTPQYHAEL